MMAGRGRGLTLPAWMTAGQNAGAPGAPQPPAAPPPPAAAAAGAPGAPPRIGAPPGSAMTGLSPSRRPAPAAYGNVAGGTQPHVRPGNVPIPPRTTMRPPPIAALPKPVWSQHSAPDGRPYFYNTVTKKSTFQKPMVRLLMRSTHDLRSLIHKKIAVPCVCVYFWLSRLPMTDTTLICAGRLAPYVYVDTHTGTHDTAGTENDGGRHNDGVARASGQKWACLFFSRQNTGNNVDDA